MLLQDTVLKSNHSAQLADYMRLGLPILIIKYTLPGALHYSIHKHTGSQKAQHEQYVMHVLMNFGCFYSPESYVIYTIYGAIVKKKHISH